MRVNNKKFFGFFGAFVSLCCFFSCKTEIEIPESKTVNYKVSHMLQNIDDDEYSEDEVSVLEGTAGQITKAEPKTYEGFSLHGDIKQETISSKGSTIVKIYYDRNLYDITFYTGGGTFQSADKSGENVSSVTLTFKYGQKIVPPEVSKDGYKVEWPDFGTARPGMNLSYTAEWTEDSAKNDEQNADYTIKHFIQNLSGDGWIEQTSDESKGQGKTDSETEFTSSDAKSYEGFEFQTVENTTIKDDGSATVSFYYTRKSFTLTFDAGEGKFADGKSKVEKSFKFEEPVEIPEAKLEGYSASWSAVPNLCPAKDAAYTVTWVPSESTQYSIKHFVQNLDGSTWTEKEADRKTGHGKTGSMTKFTAADAKTYTGFTLDRIENTIISSDGKATVKFYYKRNIVKMTFDAGEGTFSDGSHVKEFTGLYGAAVSVEKPTRDFWICTAWFLESSTAHLAPEFGYSDIKSFPLESTKYEAKWDATFKLTAAKDDKGNDVLSNFSTQFETGIEIHDQDFKLNGGSNKRWLSANPIIIGYHFYHKDASKSGDDKHYNAFWATNGDVNLAKHKITGTFYGQKMETDLSDDYNTITFTIACEGLYTDRGGGFFGLGTGYPFGKNGSYTLTFTRK